MVKRCFSRPDPNLCDELLRERRRLAGRFAGVPRRRSSETWSSRSTGRLEAGAPAAWKAALPETARELIDGVQRWEHGQFRTSTGANRPMRTITMDLRRERRRLGGRFAAVPRRRSSGARELSQGVSGTGAWTARASTGASGLRVAAVRRGVRARTASRALINATAAVSALQRAPCPGAHSPTSSRGSTRSGAGSKRMALVIQSFRRRYTRKRPKIGPRS
jgi:hypothetical protein